MTFSETIQEAARILKAQTVDCPIGVGRPDPRYDDLVKVLEGADTLKFPGAFEGAVFKAIDGLPASDILDTLEDILWEPGDQREAAAAAILSWAKSLEVKG